MTEVMNRRSATQTKGRPIGIRLDEDVLAEIEKMAEEDERSVSFMINRICKEYLATKRKRETRK